MNTFLPFSFKSDSVLGNIGLKVVFFFFLQEKACKKRKRILSWKMKLRLPVCLCSHHAWILVNPLPLAWSIMDLSMSCAQSQAPSWLGLCLIWLLMGVGEWSQCQVLGKIFFEKMQRRMERSRKVGKCEGRKGGRKEGRNESKIWNKQTCPT